MSYSTIAMDHANNPRNVGVLDNSNGIGQCGKLGQGNYLVIYVVVRESIIEDVKFQTYGCPGAIACGSMVTELVRGKSLDEAKTITTEILLDALGGLPLGKRHCASLAATALANAIDAVDRDC